MDGIKITRENGMTLYEDKDDYNCPHLRKLLPSHPCLNESGSSLSSHEIEQFLNSNTELITCLLEKDSQMNIFFPRILGLLMILSSLCLLLTFIIYALIWRQHNIHGYIIMAHTVSMFFMYGSLSTRDIIHLNFPHLINTPLCFINGVLTHFFVLSTFSWLTLTSFHIWLTFRSIFPLERIGGCQMKTPLLIGWGIPGLFVLVSASLDHWLKDKCTTILLPKYGKRTCYVDFASLDHYVIYPVIVTLIVDGSLFCGTLFNLWQYKRKSGSKVVMKRILNNQRQQLTVYTRLFIVTGMIWIVEYLLWLNIGSLGRKLYWALIDSINLFQSIAILIIYVCKLDILQSFEKVYPNSAFNKYILRKIRRNFLSGQEKISHSISIPVNQPSFQVVAQNL